MKVTDRPYYRLGGTFVVKEIGQYEFCQEIKNADSSRMLTYLDCNETARKISEWVGEITLETTNMELFLEPGDILLVIDRIVYRGSPEDIISTDYRYYEVYYYDRWQLNKIRDEVEELLRKVRTTFP